MSSLPRSTQAAILRDLATHPKMRAAMGVVALRHDVTAAIVSQVAKANGYPDKQAMWAAAERLRTTGETPDIETEDARPSTAPQGRGGWSEQDRAKVAVPPPQPPKAAPGGLVGIALSHDSPLVRDMAERVRAQLERLRQTMRVEDERAAETARRAAEVEQSQADVDRLTIELADAKARLKQAQTAALADATGARRRRASQSRHQRQREFLTRHGVTARQVRDWARANGRSVAHNGFLPVAVMADYEQAHPSPDSDERQAS